MAAVAASASPAAPGRYENIMKGAMDEYEKKMPDYRTKAKKIAEKLIEWGNLYKQWKDIAPEEPIGIRSDENGRFWKEVNVYIEYRNMRDDLEEMVEIFNDAINQCTVAPLDETTIAILEKMGIDVKPIREKYKELFETEFGKMEGRRTEINELLTQVRDQLLALRVAGERLAVLCTTARKSGGIGTFLYTAASTALNYTTTATPAFSAAVQHELAQRKQTN